MRRNAVVIAVTALALGLTFVLQPNLLLALRSPRALAFAGGTALVCVLVGRLARRAGLRPQAATALAVLPAVAVLGLVVIRPIVDSRELDEALPSAPAPVSTPAVGADPVSAKTTEKVASGTLKGLDGHAASGQVSTFTNPDGSRLIRFENVDIGGTPDPKVYLQTGKDRTGKEGGILLGELKAERGSFNYALPKDFDDENFTVVVWCGQFAVNVAHATQATLT